MSRGAYPTRTLNPQLSKSELADFLDSDNSVSARTLFVGNLDQRVTRKLLYELMSQAGPVYSIKIVPLRDGVERTFAFVVFEHAVSVRFAMLVFEDVSLFRSKLSLNYTAAHKNKTRPVGPAPRGQSGPTFFELPQGFENASEEEKRLFVTSWLMPHPNYNTGYFTILDPATSSQSVGQAAAFRESESTEYLHKRRQDEVLPENKRRRFSPPSLGANSQTQQSMNQTALPDTSYNTSELPDHYGFRPQTHFSEPYRNNASERPESHGFRLQPHSSSSFREADNRSGRPNNPNHYQGSAVQKTSTRGHHQYQEYHEKESRNGWRN